MIVAKAKPRAQQKPPVFLTRHTFQFADPTGLSPTQWRLIANEPINRMAQRFITRELCALSFTFTSIKKDADRAQDYRDRWETLFETGEGFDVWLSRIVDDVCTLPFGAASELGYKGDDLDWVLHVDAGTLLPTYDDSKPYVQVNPDNWLQRVYFTRKQLKRLRANPRTDLRYKEFQSAPTEDAFLAIEAMSKIYLYYMQQLSDTPPPGILDVMDMTRDSAEEWARSFRELLEGVDSIKIPVLYDHTLPAKWIPFSRTPHDLNIVEQFKRFAEIVLGKYGLSIGDLRLFEHESTKAGERVSQLVTERSGIGYWASVVEAYLNRILPSDIVFAFRQPRPEKELIVAQRQQTQVATLQLATGGQALMDVTSAQEQAKEWDLFSIDLTTLPEVTVPATPVATPGKEPTQRQMDQVEETREAFDDATLATKMAAEVAIVVKAELGEWVDPPPSTVDELAGFFADQFIDAGQRIREAAITKILADARELVAETEATVDDTIKKTAITDAAESKLHEAFTVLFDKLFFLGYIDRETRIAVSGAIGDWLPQLSDQLQDIVAENVEIADADLRLLAKSMQEWVSKATKELDVLIEKLLDLDLWWEIPSDRVAYVEELLEQFYHYGFGKAAAEVEMLRLGLAETPALIIDWNLKDPMVLKLIEDHAAEMVVNVNNGTKFYLRGKLKEAVEQGFSTPVAVEMIQSELFGLPAPEAEKFTRERITSIVNYEVNKAMSGAAFALRDSLGLKLKQWFTNRVSPCELCIGNEARGVVKREFEYQGVFGTILYPPAHPTTCRCVVTAEEAEVRALGTEPIEWPLTIKAMVDGKGKGGPGSGHWAHAGRPGVRGGSASSLARYGSRRPTAGGEQRRLKVEALFNDMGDGDYQYASKAARSEVKSWIVNELSERTGVEAKRTNYVVGQWAQSSNNNDMRSLSLQEAASEEFDVPLAEWQKSRIEPFNEYHEAKEAADVMYEKVAEAATTGTASATELSAMTREYGALLSQQEAARGTLKVGEAGLNPLLSRPTERKLLRAMYDNTQEELSALGFKPNDKITLYRGVRLPDSATWKWRKGDTVNVVGNTLESWSLDSLVAGRFATGLTGGPSIVKKTGFVLKIDVPVEAVVGTALTGFGCLTEGEFVVLGSTRGQAVVADVH